MIFVKLKLMLGFVIGERAIALHLESLWTRNYSDGWQI